MDLPPWLGRTYAEITESVQAGRLAHAIMLDGVPGWGIETLASRVSELILDVAEGYDLERNLDYLHLDLEGRSRFISIEQIREATEFLGNTSRESTNKLVVIDHADKLSIPASHALLKILEEPPGNSHLLLVTTNFSLILPTIRSRCQRLVVSPGSRAEVDAFFAARDVDETKLKPYLEDYGGAPFAAMEAVEEDRLNVTEKLAETARQQTPIATVVESLREDADDLLLRWQYVTLRLAHNSAVVGPVAKFYDELSDIRRQFREVPGLDRNRQFVRLLIKWRELIRTHSRVAV